MVRISTPTAQKPSPILMARRHCPKSAESIHCPSLSSTHPSIVRPQAWHCKSTRKCQKLHFRLEALGLAFSALGCENQRRFPMAGRGSTNRRGSSHQWRGQGTTSPHDWTRPGICPLPSLNNCAPSSPYSMGWAHRSRFVPAICLIPSSAIQAWLALPPPPCHSPHSRCPLLWPKKGEEGLA